jgi:hypothetical protein
MTLLSAAPVTMNPAIRALSPTSISDRVAILPSLVEGVGVGVGVGVDVALGVGVDVAVAVGVGLAVAEGVGVGLAVAEGVGVWPSALRRLAENTAHVRTRTLVRTPTRFRVGNIEPGIRI